jgi:hypothetical protein
MRWYYKWKLNKIHAEIEALKESTQSRLLENYMDHSRLRTLNRMAESLQARLAKYKYSDSSAGDQVAPLP